MRSQPDEARQYVKGYTAIAGELTAGAGLFADTLGSADCVDGLVRNTTIQTNLSIQVTHRREKSTVATANI